MPFYVRSGGAWRTTTVPSVRGGGAWRTAVGLWVRSGGAWRRVFAPGTAQSVNYSSQYSGFTPPTVSFFANGGSSVVNGSGGNWYSTTSFSNVGASYRIKFTLVSAGGTLTGSSMDTWHTLSGGPWVGHFDTTGGTTTIDYVIAELLSETAIASGSITLMGDGT